jgi:hypothetical protein
METNQTSNMLKQRENFFAFVKNLAQRLSLDLLAKNEDIIILTREGNLVAQVYAGYNGCTEKFFKSQGLRHVTSGIIPEFPLHTSQAAGFFNRIIFDSQIANRTPHVRLQSIVGLGYYNADVYEAE